VLSVKIAANEKGFRQYGRLKNFSLALVLLANKDKQITTFSKAHIALNGYWALALLIMETAL
jgi:hypothetical protein